MNKRLICTLLAIFFTAVILLSSCKSETPPITYTRCITLERCIDRINDNHDMFYYGDKFVGQSNFGRYEPYVLENPTAILFHFVEGNQYGTGAYFIFAYNESPDAQYGMEYMLEQIRNNNDSFITSAVENLGDNYVSNLLNCALEKTVGTGAFADRDRVLSIVIDELTAYSLGREPYISTEYIRIEAQS